MQGHQSYNKYFLVFVSNLHSLPLCELRVCVVGVP